jgi:hypothetical protein
MQRRGADLGYGRTLPRLLREAGMADVRADVYFPLCSPAAVTIETNTINQVRRQLVDGGLATDGQIDQHLAALASGQLDLATGPLVSAWGRKPG